jgi:transcriptional regulator with PAS, ATPase and Fis domain
MARKHQREVAAVSDEVMKMFQQNNWPGNVRELRNVLERAIIVCELGAKMIEARHLPPGFGHLAPRSAPSDPNAVRLGIGTTVGEAERLLILKTLESTNNNKTRAAEILGISLKTLHNKLKEYEAASFGTAAETSA